MSARIQPYFLSNNHKRYENSVLTGKNNYGAYRCFCFDFIGEVNDVEIYDVKIHILDESLSSLGDKMQMSSKIMIVYSISEKQVLMRGLESAMIEDEFGNIRKENFSDYGVELNYLDGNLNNVTLKLYDRNIEINYFNE